MRLFLDANVLFAAAHSPDGRAAALLALAGKDMCSVMTSPHALEEARRNIIVKSPESSDRLVELLAVVDVTGEADPRLVRWAAGHGLPSNDAPILAAAVAAEADVLVTGDRTHFGHLFGKTIGGVEVSTLAEALGAVLDRPAR